MMTIRPSASSALLLASLLLGLIFASRCAEGGYADPSVLDSTIHRGMIIDAGSSGSRMHIYEWEPRVFKSLPPPISIPGSTNQWTQRMEPGISSFSSHPEGIPGALAPLIDFAKEILKDHEEDWGKFPVFLKATAGMRQLSYEDREAILGAVRDFLGDPTTCPFYFAFDHARVISGEEEGIYGWAAVNFLRGQLIQQSKGAGTANSKTNMTAGTLDLGGASSQISFFKSDQDILANLFKLQIGGQKHWNVYTHSFLQFGLNSARTRMHTKVAAEATGTSTSSSSSSPLTERSAPFSSPQRPWSSTEGRGGRPTMNPDMPSLVTIVDACLPKGFNESFVSPSDGKTYIVIPAEDRTNMADCDKQTYKLLESQASSNNFCQFAFPGQCSVLGTYQPTLPQGEKSGHFYGFAGYYKLWQFLNLPEETSVSSLVEEGRRVCGMSYDELASYNEGRSEHSKKNAKYLHKYCFMSSYITTLLQGGFGFPPGEKITFVDEVNGYKVDWALGSMLYEINALPWSYAGPDPPSAASPPVDSKADVQAVAEGPATATPAAGVRVGAAGGGEQGGGGGGGGGSDHKTVFWGIAAVATIVVLAWMAWGRLNHSTARCLLRGRRGQAQGREGGGEEASPWRVTAAVATGGGSEGRVESRRFSSAYESMSDVSPRTVGSGV